MLKLNERIKNYIENKEMENLKQLLTVAEDMEILQAFHDLSAEEQVITFRLLSKEMALNLFEDLDADMQENLLRSFTDERAIEFVNELAPDDIVRLFDEMPATVAKNLTALLSKEERKNINILMGYEAETAGRIMTTEFISLKKDMKVDAALELVRKQAQEKETVYMLYVTDRQKKLEGVLSLKELILAKANETIEDVMTHNVVTVSTSADQEEVAQTLQELDLLALPVVDSENRLVGIVTIDDAIDILEEEATEDILVSGGIFANKEEIRSETLISGSLASILKVRLPFLFITILAGMFAAMVIDGFEEILEAVVIVAFFIPLIMDMGGNIGTQSSTVFARGVVLGHIDMDKFFRHLAKEIGVGFVLGVISASIAGVGAAVWQSNVMLGLAVGIALVATMTIAAFAGFVVPFMLVKFNFDQAAGSAPIITSIKDISGLLVYFICVSIFLGGMIYEATNYEVTEIHITRECVRFVLDPEAETATAISIVAGCQWDFELPEQITVMGEYFDVIDGFE